MDHYDDLIKGAGVLPDRGPHLLPGTGPGLPGLPGLLCNRPRQQLIRGAGTFLLTPLAQKMLDAWGWRGAMRGLAVLACSSGLR